MKHELRINNYVLYDNRPFQIASISDEFPTLNTIEFGIGVVDWNNISPIPLTEELLVKCGGIKLDKPYLCYNVNGIQLILRNDGWIEYVHNIEMKSLHQLQNFHLETKRTELTIEI